MTLTARSFPPLEGPHATLLILGSMPGRASLEAARYYAHPRNAFWPIVMALLDESEAMAKARDGTSSPPNPDAAYASATKLGTAARHGAAPQLPDYGTRVARLTGRGVALWDVLAECVRPGSLDAAIRRESERPNDLAALCERHPELATIAFNGQTAAKLFERHAGAAVRERRADIRYATLPSTSPAYASLTLAAKHERWRKALRGAFDPL